MSYETLGLAQAFGNRLKRNGKEIAQLRQEIKKLKWELAQSRAHAAGLDAQVAALLDTHESSPLRARTNVPYSGPERKGKFKTKLGLIYEGAFDSACRAMRISDPRKLRID